MRHTFAVIAVAVLIALVQTGFVSALPAPVSQVHLPLLFVVGLVTAFRFSDAYAAALAAGFTADALSSLPFGSHALVLLTACAVTSLLFTRVFTHHSRRGNVALHAVAYGLAAAVLAVVHVARGTFSGLPLLQTLTEPWWRVAGGALAAQLIAAVGAMLLVSAGRRAFGRTFMVRPQSYAR